MNRMHILARITLAGLGVYALLNYLPQIIMGLPLWVTNSPVFFGVDDLFRVLPTVLIFIIIGVIVYQLLCKTDRWASAIVAKTEKTESDVKTFPLPVMYRLLSVLCGVLFLYKLILTIASTMNYYFLVRATSGSKALIKSRLFSPQCVLTWLILLVAGVYLLCWAPHFVRWQVKKTRQLTEKS